MVYDCPEPLLGATNVYHMSLYVAHSQSKPVGSRAKTSFLVMKEFNAEFSFKINLCSQLLRTSEAASKGNASAAILDL